MRKKGSLNLSVNAIVVLILAITMLGLGLGFMKGMFGKVSGKIDAAIDSADLKNPPSLDDPLTISTKTITINRGGSGDVQVAYLNTNVSSEDVLLEVVCTGTDFDSADGTVQYGGKSVDAAGTIVWTHRKVHVNEVTGWNVFINVPKNLAAGTSRCTAMVSDVTVASLPLTTESNIVWASAEYSFIKYEDFFVKVP